MRTPPADRIGLGALLRTPLDRAPSERVRWLITLRWIVLTVAAVVVILANAWLGNVLPVVPLWATLVGIAVYNLIFWYVAQYLGKGDASSAHYEHLVHVQVLSDLVALTILLHFSGGLENPFSVYYLPIVVVGSVVMTQAAGYLYASCATFLWTGLLILEGSHVIPHYNLRGFRLPVRYEQPGHIFAESFVLATAAFAVAYLTSTIVNRLRQEERQLYEANRSCEFRAAELARLNERLREMDRTRSLFIRLVTHELRAPVAAIQSYLRLILDGYVPEERLMEIVAKAERRARDQLELIGDLLDLAHLQEPPGDAEKDTCDAKAILSDVLDMMSARVRDQKLELEVDIAVDEALVQAHEEHVRQIWINLVSNAIKYTPPGGKVRVSLRREGDKIVGVVQDTGIGIAEDEQERIFEAFYRTESAKAMARYGTGLGLSIVKRIIERYGGEIHLCSTVGQGSTFTFSLPLTSPHPSQTDGPSAER